MNNPICVVFIMSLLILPFVVQVGPIPKSGSWTQKASAPEGTVWGQAAVLNDTIYVVIQNNLYKYDSGADVWTLQSAVPLPQKHLAIAGFGLSACNNKLYIIGIENNNEASNYVNLAYDPATGIWKNKTPPNFSDNVWRTEVASGKIYIMGGANGIWGEIQILANNEVYDPVNDSWSQASPLPNTCYQLCLSCVDNKIFIIGGNDAKFVGGMSPNQYT